MPNVILITRDPGHYIRIACHNPIERNTVFATQHDRLFGPTGLIKQVQFLTSYRRSWKLASASSSGTEPRRAAGSRR